MSYQDYLDLLHVRPALSITLRCNDECQRRKPIEELFFCGHCSRFVCGECSTVEIDTYFCPTCLSSVLSSYAYQDENRCQKCVECPSCFTTLTSVMAPATKEYTYFCEYCKWNSSTIGLSAIKAAGLFTELKKREAGIEHKVQFEALMVQYKRQFQEAKDNREAEANQEVAMKLMEQARDRMHSDMPVLRRTRTALHEQVQKLDSIQDEKNLSINHTIPDEENFNEHVKAAPEAISDPNVYNLFNITNLQQRFHQPSQSPLTADEALPRRKHLLTKTAHRCGQCKKYVVKPKVGATHVAFDRKTFAITFVPTITVSRIPKLTLNRPTNFVMYFQNPIVAEVFVALEEVKEEMKNRSCQIFLPSNLHEVKMHAYDETSEEEEMNRERDHYSIFDKGDDPKVVAYRHLSKVGMHLTVNPLAPDRDIEFSLKIKLRSTNAELSEFEEFAFIIDVNLGPVDGARATATEEAESKTE